MRRGTQRGASDEAPILTIPVIGFEVPLEIVVLGLLNGLTYGLLAVGLTLIFKATRVINFAYGEMGALPATLMLVLVAQQGLPYALGLLAALVVAIAVGVLVERLVIRRLAKAPRLVVLVATIGVSQVLLGIGAAVPKTGNVALGSASFPVPFRSTITIGNLRLGTGQLMILVLAPCLALGISMFLYRSKLGLGVRASADNMDAAQLVGVPTAKVSIAIWVLVALLSAASAILIGPTRPTVTRVALGPTLMVRGLAASVAGGMNSLPQVFAAGVGLGVLESLVAWNYPIGGVFEFVLLLVIVGTLFLRRELGQLTRGGDRSTWTLGGGVRSLSPRLLSDPRVRTARRIGLVAALVLAVVVALPLQSSQLVLLSSVALFATIGLSVVVLTGFAGQVSLAQFSFVGLGALVGGRMYQLGFPAWMGVLYAITAGAVAAVVIGVSSLRVQGLYLAVATLAFAIVSGSWLLEQRWLVSSEGASTSMGLPRSEWLGVDFRSERSYYWLVLAVLVVVACLVHRVRVSGVGRTFMAVRDNELGASMLAISPRRKKIEAFVLAGAIASCAGYFYGGLLVNFSSASLFSPDTSLVLITMVVFGGVTTITGSLLGTLWVVGIPYFFGSTFGLLSSGLGVLVVLQLLPQGLASVAFRMRDSIASKIAGIKESTAHLATDEIRRRDPLPKRSSAVAGSARPLAADDITVRFGGNVAVDSVSMWADRTEVVGLVGPNGAGKTTLFDALSGHVRPSTGRVFVDGVDVSEMRPEQRAARGLARTFQQARLFDDLALIDAVKVSLELSERSEIVPSLLALPPSIRAERAKHTKAAEVLELMGLADFSDRRCADLSTGMRRLAELACLVALGNRVLLLDEPMAGIAQREVESFAPVLREIRDHLGATLVVIDHDLPMLLEIADRIYVLAAGAVICEGRPDDVRRDSRVISAYLGTDERFVARSGAISAAKTR